MSARKFDLNKAKSYGNVTVARVVDADGAKTKVYLHGNLVFEHNRDTNAIRLDHCGWITATTATAINTALSQVRPDMRVFRKLGTMFISFANGDEQGVLIPSQWYGV